MPHADLFRSNYAAQGRDVPWYAERLHCYTCYSALVAPRFFAHTGQRAPYDWARERVQSSLGREDAGGA